MNKNLRLVLLLTLILALPATPSDGKNLQNGFQYTNPRTNLTSGKLSVSFSGNFPGEGPICLIPAAEVRIWPGQSRRFVPPAGFTVSDVITFWTRRVPDRNEDGSFKLGANGKVVFTDGETRISNIDDPPGAKAPRFELRESAHERIYNYLYLGPDLQIGPVQTTLPIVTDGTMTDGVPNLFVAQQDPKTGLPIINAGAGHCFVPSTVRANHPGQAKILPHLLWVGKSTVYGTIDALSDADVVEDFSDWKHDHDQKLKPAHPRQ